MIDANKIETAITTKLAEAVGEQVEELFKNDTELLRNLRSQATSLVVRNFNLDKLVAQNMAGDVAKLIAEQLVAQESEDALLDLKGISKAVGDNIADATAAHVATMIDDDSSMLLQLKTHAITALVRNINVTTDIESIIADQVKEQFAEQFDSGSIHSDASKREMTIMDDAVVVEHTLVSKNVSVVEHFSAKSATVSGDFLVRGNVDTNTSAWDGLTSSIKDNVVSTLVVDVEQKVLDNVVARADLLNFKNLKLDGTVVLSGNTLGNQITQSSLTSVGTLTDLNVTGTTTLGGGAVHIEGKRVGINTTTPTSGLDIWDDEVEIIAGKLKLNTAYIGTNRAQDLVLGVNQRPDLKIDCDGIVTIQKLKLGTHSIRHGAATPNYSGATGDLVLNTAFTVADPVFAWFCVENFSWVPLRAA